MDIPGLALTLILVEMGALEDVIGEVAVMGPASEDWKLESDSLPD